MKLKIKSLRVQGNETKERLVISVLADCSLDDFMVLDNTYSNEHLLSNEDRHTYIFPFVSAKEGDVIILYTGKGTDVSKENDKGTITYYFYWGLKTPVWNDEGDCAYLVKIADADSKCVGD